MKRAHDLNLSRRISVALAVFALTATSAAATGVRAQTKAAPLTPKGVEACLHHEKVTYDYTLPAGLSRLRKLHLLPLGVTAQLDVQGDLPGAPIPGPVIDQGSLWFFRSPSLARAGVSKLVSVWIFGRGIHLPPAAEALLLAMGLQTPPTQAAAASLHQTHENVVVLWQYPRRHRINSDRIIRACLA